MRVVVLGAGAIGSLLGARLSQSGHAVTLIGRPEHVAAIRGSGLRILGEGEAVVRVDADDHWPVGPTPDVALITTKTFDLRRAAESLAQAQALPIPTLLPQNGLGVESIAGDALRHGGWPDPPSWIVRAVNSIPATLVAPGVVRAAGTGELLFGFAERAGEAGPATRVLGELLASSGLPVRTVGDLRVEVWRKAIVNAAINPVTALHAVPNGELAAGPLRTEAVTLLKEALSVANREGVSLPDVEALGDFDRVVRATAQNRSSMLQDLDRGRPTEIDAISGELLRRAEAHGLDLPATRRALDSVHRRAGRGAPQGS